MILNFLLDSNKWVPISAPIIENNIPLINKRCGGLSSPSNPKFVCHQLSNWPENTSTRHPKAISFSGSGILRYIERGFFKEVLCFIEIVIPITVAIIDKPTPEYNTVCGVVKNDSTLTTPCHMMSQLAAPTCRATPNATRK
jgi:hypothetical protein